MDEKDLRDCFAMFKALTGASPDECYMFAEAMLVARKKEELKMPISGGIVGIKTVKRTRKNNDEEN